MGDVQGLAEPPRVRPPVLPPLDGYQLRRSSLVKRALRWFLAHPDWLLRSLRALCPILRLGNWAFVLRYDDVLEVLTRGDVFATPYGSKIEEVDRARTNFLLGMNDGPTYRSQLAAVMHAMRREDLGHIGQIAAGHAASVLGPEPAGDLDVVKCLFTPATTRIVEDYFGIPMPQMPNGAHELALWAMALSNYLFATYTQDRTAMDVALAAGQRLDAQLDWAIATAAERYLAGALPPMQTATLLERLVQAECAAGAAVTPNDVQNAVRPILAGLTTAFVPNCTVAATHILLVLLENRDAMNRCREAARHGDDAVLARHLLEAFRLWPLLPGPLRTCTRRYELAANTSHARTLRPGTTVLASTQSAMLDGRAVANPRLFDPNRPVSNSMQFGYGLHSCVGTALATTQVVNTLRPLLTGRAFRRARGAAGTVAYFGAFPESLHITFIE